MEFKPGKKIYTPQALALVSSATSSKVYCNYHCPTVGWIELMEYVLPNGRVVRDKMSGGVSDGKFLASLYRHDSLAFEDVAESVWSKQLIQEIPKE